MSTSSMGWMPILENPANQLANAIAMKLLERKIEEPDELWKRQMAEKQFGLSERSQLDDERTSQLNRLLAQKGFERGGEQFAHSKSMDLSQLGLAQEGNRRAWGQLWNEEGRERRLGEQHASEMGIRKLQAEDLSKFREEQNKIKKSELEIRLRQIQGQEDYRSQKASEFGKEHARKVIKDGIEQLNNPLMIMMQKNNPDLYNLYSRTITEAIKKADSYLGETPASRTTHGVGSRIEGFGSESMPQGTRQSEQPTAKQGETERRVSAAKELLGRLVAQGRIPPEVLAEMQRRNMTDIEIMKYLNSQMGKVR